MHNSRQLPQAILKEVCELHLALESEVLSLLYSVGVCVLASFCLAIMSQVYKCYI